MLSRESNASPRGSPFVDQTIEMVIRGLATILICSLGGTPLGAKMCGNTEIFAASLDGPSRRSGPRSQDDTPQVPGGTHPDRSVCNRLSGWRCAELWVRRSRLGEAEMYRGTANRNSTSTVPGEFRPERVIRPWPVASGIQAEWRRRSAAPLTRARRRRRTPYA